MATLSRHLFSAGTAGPVRPAFPIPGLVLAGILLVPFPILAFGPCVRVKTMRGPARRQGGFTLLEVLIAFVIVALALGVLFQGATQSLGSVRTTARYQEALSRARSHMAAVGQSGPLVAGTQSGDDGSGFRWRTDISPLATIPVTGGSRLGSRAVLYAVTATISWGQNGQGGAGQRREVRLLTRRVGTAPAAVP